MSNYDAASKAQEQAQQRQKGPEAFLTQDERQQLGRMLGFPEDIPPKFKSWMQDYLSVNFPQIPITQISGFEKYLYKKGTSLPADPKDGQEFAYIADSTNGVTWRFQYNADSGSTYKWEFVGGAPIMVALSSGSSTTSSTYNTLGGPAVVLPLAGDYNVSFGATISNTVVGRDTVMGVGTATSAVDADLIDTEGLNQRIANARSALVNVPNAGDTLSAYYRIKTQDCTGSFYMRWILVQPVRVKKA